ncbi:MAG: hypothetical protein COB53_04690 [Elusimicrobia bacterium]|nr:MAG: hypothetical protein COB53_04690 [Elusimicrobiota bacterium]
MAFDFFKKKRDPNTPRPVLVIDDSEPIRELIEDVLLSQGYTVEKAEDGKKGLEAAKEVDPRLILLDINMPGWTGLQTLAEMRQVPELNEIPVLMVTGEQLGKDVEAAFARGAKGYVIKPIEIKRFLKKVEEFVLPMK